MDKSKPNILCIALTPALDHYVTADGFAIGKINRAMDVMERAGERASMAPELSRKLAEILW